MLAAALASLTLAACTRGGETGAAGSGAGASSRHAWTIPDTVRLATVASVNTLNPLLSTTVNETVAQELVMDPLVATDPQGHDIPILAAQVPSQGNGGISRDGRTITYHLRHGVRWQDGAPFSSRDVAFTFAAIMNPSTNVSTRHGWDQIDHVETPDPYTAVFRLKRPFAPAIRTFFGFSDSPFFVLPAHLLATYHDLNRVSFNEHPIGTGPFRIVRWIRGDRIEYVANDGYFLGRPKLRRVQLRFVPDENTISNQLKAHEIDWFLFPTPRVYPNVHGVDGVVVPLVPLNSYDAIQINMSHPPLDDARVRLAIGLAVDKKELVREITFGTAIPATEDLPPHFWAFDPGAGTTARDLPRAKALLDQAGWRTGPDGVRVKNGRRLTLGLAYQSATATDRQRSVLVAAMLKDAGIALELKGYTTSLLFAPVGTGIMADGRYDLGLTSWFAGADPDDSTQLLCDQIPPHGWNWSRYCNHAMDAAQADALSHYDIAARKRTYSRIERLLAQDNPFIYLWWPRQMEPMSVDLHGARPNGFEESWNAKDWSI
ncbi:MAG: peptide ABC transporter substrate-binding protein [Candidatus Eremiobacteraeota bacterium]|nr:peptide ABC transporter substrate-binding protein [Candidatus Eremiobacteraeota bacterium]